MNFYHEFTPSIGLVDWIFIILSIVAMVVVGFRQSQWQDGCPTWVAKKSNQVRQVHWAAIGLAVLFGIFIFVEHGNGLIQWYDNTAGQPALSPASAALAATIMSVAYWLVMRLVAWIAGLAKHGWLWMQRARYCRRLKSISAGVSPEWKRPPRHAKPYIDEMRYRQYCQQVRKAQKAYKESQSKDGWRKW